MWARAEEQARASGIDLDLSKQPRTYRTRKDHTLVRLARVKGTQHALANAIAWAYFMEQQTTADEAVLADIAAQHGYARDEALQVMHDADALGETHDSATAAAQQGIQGVPFFVFDQRFANSSGISGRNPLGCASTAAETRSGARFNRFQMNGPPIQKPSTMNSLMPR
jgi:predicted DsbA family dithiol-disulfide isomerase